APADDVPLPVAVEEAHRDRLLRVEFAKQRDATQRDGAVQFVRLELLEELLPDVQVATKAPVRVRRLVSEPEVLADQDGGLASGGCEQVLAVRGFIVRRRSRSPRSFSFVSS
ncbi:MAG TPA: hypothetical protein VF167_01905, partial [Longimicrobiaceae bacterium]